MKRIVKIIVGICLCCKRRTAFVATPYWFRDYYKYLRCGAIPTQRALMKILKEKCPE